MRWFDAVSDSSLDSECTSNILDLARFLRCIYIHDISAIDFLSSLVVWSLL